MLVVGVDILGLLIEQLHLLQLLSIFHQTGVFLLIKFLNIINCFVFHHQARAKQIVKIINALTIRSFK